MLDFTSALYLGMRHPSWSLPPWEQLTSGRPAALGGFATQASLTDSLARLVGCERATLGSSTLHLFWDLFGMLPRPTVVYVDEGVYPIARWGVERAAGLGVPVRAFRHYSHPALRRMVRRDACGTPVVVADGFCPGCGRIVPLEGYLDALQGRAGTLILDDTQALGIFGHSPAPAAPYGREGGGSLRLHGVANPKVVLVSSLAKAFGAPVALLAGNDAVVRAFERNSETRMHTSPPSLAVVRAAERALHINAGHGEALRLRLATLVRRFRRRCAQNGLRARGGAFPVQTLGPDLDAEGLHQRLLHSGIRTVLHRGHGSRKAVLSFLITALHAPEEIDYAVRSCLRSHATATITR